LFVESTCHDEFNVGAQTQTICNRID
jgi:hypothetical protein